MDKVQKNSNSDYMAIALQIGLNKLKTVGKQCLKIKHTAHAPAASASYHARQKQLHERSYTMRLRTFLEMIQSSKFETHIHIHGKY
jgi:hypothetical protein